MNGKVRGNPKNATVKIYIISPVIDITFICNYLLFFIYIDFTAKYKIKSNRT